MDDTQRQFLDQLVTTLEQQADVVRHVANAVDTALTADRAERLGAPDVVDTPFPFYDKLAEVSAASARLADACETFEAAVSRWRNILQRGGGQDE